MKSIEIESWERRDHFRFFRRTDFPFYNICFNLDVTEALAFCRREGISFHFAMVYLTVKAANAIENFRYRMRGEEIILHEKLHPCFTDLSPGSDLFKLVAVELDGDIAAFARRAKRAASQQKEYFPMEQLAGRDDWVFLSNIPWISFTGIDHTANFNKNDAIPRITWGKHFEEKERTLLPYNLQVNHVFIDGIHLGRFKQALESEIDGLR